jgi:hypothetical protein
MGAVRALMPVAWNHPSVRDAQDGYDDALHDLAQFFFPPDRAHGVASPSELPMSSSWT